MAARLHRLVAAVALALPAALACAQVAGRCPAQVRVSFPNFEIAPYILGTDNIEAKPGLLVEWTRLALARSGCSPALTFKRRPPNRQLAELELGQLDILPGFTYNDNPADALEFPMRDGGANTDLVVMSDDVSLYVRAGERHVTWDGRTLHSPRPRVGTSTGGSAADAIARAHGWQLEMAETPQADMKKLIAGRIDVILEPDVVLERYLVGREAKAVRKLAPAPLTSRRYAPVRKGFLRDYPEFTARFWLELCKASRQASPTLPTCR